jgi:hypothetical protein
MGGRAFSGKEAAVYGLFDGSELKALERHGLRVLRVTVDELGRVQAAKRFVYVA